MLFVVGLVGMFLMGIAIVAIMVLSMFGYAYYNSKKAVVKTQRIDPTF